MPPITSLEQLNPARFETPAILKKLASSSRKLAELKGIAASISNQGILINTLGLQEAKDSSEIENIVTTHDELFKDDVLPEAFTNPAAKEVLRYRQALRVGFEQVPLTNHACLPRAGTLSNRCHMRLHLDRRWTRTSFLRFPPLLGLT
jgi:Fic family protein